MTARSPDFVIAHSTATTEGDLRQRRPCVARALTVALLGISLCSPIRAEREPTVDVADGEAAPLPRPALNHLYVVLDAETFSALRDSHWVERVLASADAGLPNFQRPTEVSDRLFLRGRTTYLEFFAPDNRFGEPVGKVGVALGLDAPADLGAVERSWRRAYGADVRRSEVKFSRTDPAVPWYDAVQVDATSNNPHLVVWAMTYRPEFVSWLSGDAGTGSRTRRVDALATRWKDGQNFQDIAGVSIVVSRPRHEEIVEQLQHAGMRHDGGAGHTRLGGDGWYLMIQPGDSDASGLEYIDLHAVGSIAAGCGFTIGNSTVEVEHAGRMRWRFGTKGKPSLPPCQERMP